jgi:DNA-binding beta-propeller fold protein YncE
MRSPALAGLAIAVFVLGILVGINFVGDRGSRSGNVLASVSAGDKPAAVATDGRTIWVADEGSGRVLAFDLATLTMRWAVAVGPRPVALAYGFDAVWVVDAGDRQLRKLSPVDGHVLAQANSSLGPVAVAAVERVWVLAAGNATVDGYDPQTLVQDRSGRDLTQPTSMAAGSGALWVAAGGSLHRVPSAGGESTGFDVGADSELVAVSPQVIWVTSAHGELRAIDPATGQVLARTALPGRPTAITAGPTGAAVATDDGSVSWIAAPGAQPVVLARTGAALTSLALAEHLLIGTSPSTGLLYRMEITS